MDCGILDAIVEIDYKDCLVDDRVSGKTELRSTANLYNTEAGFYAIVRNPIKKIISLRMTFSLVRLSVVNTLIIVEFSSLMTKSY